MAAKLTRLTHKIVIQLHLLARELYHLHFLLQAACLETSWIHTHYYPLYSSNMNTRVPLTIKS